MKLVSVGIKDIIGFSTAWSSNLNRIVLYGYLTGGFQSIVGLCRNSSCSRFKSSNNAFTADLCKKGDVLVSNIRPYFKKIIYCFTDCGCSTDVLCFVPDKIEYSAYLYCALYSDKFFDYMVAGSKGTKMPRGDKQQIMMYPICIPYAEYLEQFSRTVAPMLETVYTNRLEANNLAILRDTLLPKLMNGEIDVSEVKI